MHLNSYIIKLITFSENENKFNPEWRRGQSLVNCATLSCYHLCETLFTTNVDCFYNDEKITSFINALNNKMKTETPFVGIFWIKNGFTILSHAVHVSEGLKYGDAITGIKDHADYCEERKKRHEYLPTELEEEYFLLPRGRVVYHTDSDRYYVFHGNNVRKTDLNQIIDLFCLPKEKTIFEQDIHYCELSEEEWCRL